MSERTSRMRSKSGWRRRGLVVAGLLVALPVVAQQNGALYALGRESNRLAWDGLQLGTSLVAAERRLGVTLALAKNPSPTPCANFVAEADYHGIRVTLGFKKPSPAAKIDWMRVRFEGQQVAVGATELVAELKALFPDAKWTPPAGAPETVESDDLTPIYAVPGGKETQAVRLYPREAIELATGVNCYG